MSGNKYHFACALFIPLTLALSACGGGGGGGGSSPPVNAAPQLSITGQQQLAIQVGSAYVDQGATASDSEDGDITPQITMNSDVDTATPGTYAVTYNVTDSGGTAATESVRVVVVVATIEDATGIANIVEVDGEIEATLLNGEVVLLDSVEEREALNAQFPITPEQEVTMANLADIVADNTSMKMGATGASAYIGGSSGKPAPGSFSLAADQTPIRNQFARGTCVSFAVVAAIEAAYKRRFDLELDLSEQFVNHLQKTVSIDRDNPQVPFKENQLGFWSGSAVSYLLNVFTAGYRIPPETDHPYISSRTASTIGFNNTREVGDNPRMDFRSDTILQKAVNDVNLSARAVDYSIPQPFNHIAFPIDASDNARYGIRSFGRISTGELNNIEMYKTLIASSYEIIVQANITDDASPGDDVRHPSDDPDDLIGSHAVIFLGYNDTDRTFIVKNSWGGSSFEKWSYDWVSEGEVNDAAIILGLKSDYESPAPEDMPQRFIGRWYINMNGIRGELDITRLPGTYPSLNGQVDRRVGAYYAEDGSVYRVNGQFFGDRLTFYFDENEPNLNYESLQGHRFDAYFRYFSIFTQRDKMRLAGTMVDANDGEIYGFYATRIHQLSGRVGEYYSSTAGVSPLAAESYIGTWTIGDYQVAFHQVNNELGVVYGTVYSVFEEEITATLSQGNRRIDFRVTEDIFDYQNYSGYLFTNELGVFSGEVTQKPSDSEEITRGFIAVRRSNSPPIVSVTSPGDNTSVPRGSRNVEFRVDVTDLDGEIVTITWVSDVDGEIGTTAEFNRNDLSYGTHQITVAVDDGFSEHDPVDVSFTLTITNDPPTLDITQPNAGDRFCDSESINFRASVVDLNVVPGNTLPDESVRWHATTLAGTNFVSMGTGKEITYAFATGSYLITARATDEEGSTDRETIELAIDSCNDDSPPSVSIIDPATDSGNSDSRYSYDGYDATRAQSYTDVTVTGSASDAEDGTLTGASLVWTTNRTDLQNAVLATGANTTIRLYSNQCGGAWHEVSLTATDSDANARSQTVRLFIWTLC